MNVQYFPVIPPTDLSRLVHKNSAIQIGINNLSFEIVTVKPVKEWGNPPNSSSL
jgi:hypothetical protein